MFAGINPELELLENPVQVVINSAGMGYVNLDYPLDLVEGKNYHIKATIGKLDGSVEEYENDITAQRNDIDQPMCLLDYRDQKIIYVIDKVNISEEDLNLLILRANLIIDAKLGNIETQLEEGKIVIVTGFQGLNDEGDITTLGRGGSDTSGASVWADAVVGK